MTHAQKIIDEIQEAMGRPNGGSAFAALAADYADLCRKVNGRLEQIGEILDRGDENQALQLAEAYPPVMDEAEALCFPDADQWRSICDESQFASAPEIKSRIVQQLNLVYAKGISPNHPIYKQFRTAVLERDSEAALAIARTIEKLNPGDATAQGERMRLENKVFQAQVLSLSEALASGSEPSVMTWLERVESIGLSEKADATSEVINARDLRRTVEARKAMDSVGKYLAELPNLESADSWQRVGELLSRIDRLSADHQLALPTSTQESLNRARVFYTKRHDAVMKGIQFQGALKELLSQTDHIESVSQATGTLSLAELRELLTQLNKQWQVVEAFTLRVEDEVVQKVARIVETLRNDISRLQRKKLITMVTVTAVTVAILGISGWFLVNHYRAGDLEKEIARAMTEQRVASVRKLVADAERGGLTGKSAKLAAVVASAQTWAGSAENDYARAQEELLKLEQELGELPDEGAAAFHARVKAFEERMPKLPAEFRDALSDRFDAFSQKYSQRLTALTDSFAKVLETKVVGFESEIEPGLLKSQSLDELRTSLVAADKETTLWSTYLESGIEALRLPAAITVRAETAIGKVKSLKKKLVACDAAKDQLKAATTLDEYKQAIAKLREVDLPFSAEVKDARLAYTLDSDPDGLLARLLFPWDVTAYAAVKKGGEAVRLYPGNLLPVEATMFEKILNDQNSTGIFEATVRGTPTRVVFSKGSKLAPDFEVYDPAGRKNIQWTGSVYDPFVDGDVVHFSSKTFGTLDAGPTKAEAITGVGPSRAAVLYDALDLKGFVAPTGQPLRTGLEVIDRMNRANKKDPLFQAYVILTLGQLMEARPYAWGLHYSPSARADLANLRDIVGAQGLRSGAWLLPKQRDALEAKLKPLLDKTTLYHKEATLNQLLVARMATKGLKYAGYVGTNGTPILNDPLARPDALIGLGGSVAESVAGIAFHLEKGTEPPKFVPVEAPIPLTPLFVLGDDRQAIFEQAIRAAGIDMNTDSALRTSPLFSDFLPKP